jgi:hypothetical protein
MRKYRVLGALELVVSTGLTEGAARQTMATDALIWLKRESPPSGWLPPMQAFTIAGPLIVGDGYQVAGPFDCGGHQHKEILARAAVDPWEPLQ